MNTRKSAHRVWLGLGGNLGPIEATLASACDEIQVYCLAPISKSSLYRTAPWGVADQASFLNQVVECRTSYTPHEFLVLLQTIETKFGRNRSEETRWGPRALDIDIISWEGVELSSPRLILPHPHLSERHFVLKPFSEIAPDHVPSGYTSSIKELLEECTDKSSVICS